MSDFNKDDFVAPLDDLLQHSLQLALPYSELEHLEYDLESAARTGMPQPEYYSRAKEERKKHQTKVPSAIISLVKPHKFLSVSKDLCSFYGLSAEEITGRTIRTIQGPKTDSGAITAAIKNTGLLSSTTLKTFLYSSDGADHELSLSFSPFVAENGSLAGCELHLVQSVPPAGGPAAAAQIRMEREQYRALHNFRTGLVLQQTYTRTNAGSQELPPWL